MFLKSITLRGFKSFADRTVLEVEPGITAIVGPNGSGKSNVVDALAWVLGTHSPRRVRGGTMSDVIFAGSPARRPVGKASVEIVIDNSRGQLGTGGIGTGGSAQQFSEVRITREIFADGAGRYAINGTDCRALDIQEMLSDTGLGRELHTIVGQGQLDLILNAKPEERRAFIEEAAGILKHRRRRERALRKLDQVDRHIDKLGSILRELRRQLRPLERQAEAADRHRQLQADLRSVQARLAAHDLALLVQRQRADDDADAAVAERVAGADASVVEERAREDQLEVELAQRSPAVEAAQATYYRLTSLRERLRGTADLVEARRRHLLEVVDEAMAGRPPAQLRAQADELDERRGTRQADLDNARTALEAATAARREAELARRAHDQEVQVAARRRAELRERVVRWEGEVSALRGAIASAESETGRVGSHLAQLQARVAEAQAEVAAVQGEIVQLESAEIALTDALEAAEVDVATAQQLVDDLAVRERDVERERSSQAARGEALRAALAEHDGGAAALLAGDRPGVLGPLTDHVRAGQGLAAALAAALGPLGEAVLVAAPADAGTAIAWLREQSAGSAVLLPAGRDATPARVDGATPIADLLTPADDGLLAASAVGALRAALASTHVVGDWAAAVALQQQHPNATFVTRDGDLAGPLGYIGGQAPGTSSLVTATAAVEAEARAAELGVELLTVHASAELARASLAGARERLREETATINESDAALSATAERLARLNRELQSLAGQREVVEGQAGELQAVLTRDRTMLDQLHARGPEVDAGDLAEPGPDIDAERLDLALEEAREVELDTRLRAERVEEQLRHLADQVDELRREADRVEAALADAARRRELRKRNIERCGALSQVADSALLALEGSLGAAGHRREELQAELQQRRETLGRVRARLEEATAILEGVREEQHASDLRRADLQHELDTIGARVRAEFGLSNDELLAEHPEAADADRVELVEREDVFVRKIGLLGRVNPLALEEFKALEERHAFLSGQLDDLRRSKRDLLKLVEEVDVRIREIFRVAYEDVAAEFEEVFQIVFPGGKGRLVLTDPDDLLATGIEVEAQPPGKRVTRLSLLSGGERSLTVLAFVFAIFRARPSPFYVLDEVDAALDDVNLQRLLTVVSSLREQAQIIMVTHMKRSMEIADLMYGITMGDDAVTKVVADRMESAEAVA